MCDVARWLTKDEQRTWRAYLMASRVLFDQLDRELQHDAGLPHAYYEILVRLSEAPGRALRMGELADSLLVSRSRVSHAVTRLSEAGWVRRQEHRTDRRGTTAILTDAGYQILARAAPGHVAGVRAHLFDQLSREQQDQLRTISEALLAKLRADQRPDAPAD